MNILHVLQCIACIQHIIDLQCELVCTCMVRQNLPAVNIGSVASEHPDPRKMGAVWFSRLFVQNLKYSSEAASALHFVGWAVEL